MSGQDNIAWLTTVRASLPELKEVLAIRGKARSKSAFMAIRAEIKRFYKEQGVDVYKLPTFDDFTPEGIAAQARERDLEILHHRRLLATGNLTASRAIAERPLSTETAEEVSHEDTKRTKTKISN